ncbi:hypothetical protein CY34DRAFT_15767 [Suillus luteus UH-Slu-Lm8-n1]|uniref:Unplaced genomic scaffold CY34scaffold_327, whole genome shotgun sequence n=1 Tax=Suillus luteus UH-Slu-Lm8-n1 TaxID=930992 RepID=A0A0D0AGR1_9AGAM|nr:hypothetical protein CY34DRAFT_15767 [Suillus luteus UH-Slu-Lm8-n1]
MEPNSYHMGYVYTPISGLDHDSAELHEWFVRPLVNRAQSESLLDLFPNDYDTFPESLLASICAMLAMILRTRFPGQIKNKFSMQALLDEEGHQLALFRTFRSSGDPLAIELNAWLTDSVGPTDLLKSVAGLEERLMQSGDDEVDLIADLASIIHFSDYVFDSAYLTYHQLTKGASGARGQNLVPPLSCNVKIDHSFHHEWTGALLFPAGIDWSNPETKTKLQSGENITRGNARIHGMTHVTLPSVAYIATQVRFALTLSPVFSRTDTITDSERFYNFILDVFEDPDEKQEVDALVVWRNRQVFPSYSTTQRPLAKNRTGVLLCPAGIDWSNPEFDKIYAMKWQDRCHWLNSQGHSSKWRNFLVELSYFTMSEFLSELWVDHSAGSKVRVFLLYARVDDMIKEGLLDETKELQAIASSPSDAVIAGPSHELAVQQTDCTVGIYQSIGEFCQPFSAIATHSVIGNKEFHDSLTSPNF